MWIIAVGLPSESNAPANVSALLSSLLWGASIALEKGGAATATVVAAAAPPSFVAVAAGSTWEWKRGSFDTRGLRSLWQKDLKRFVKTCFWHPEEDIRINVRGSWKCQETELPIC